MFAALYDEANEGWVWLPITDFLCSRECIRITVTARQKTVYCDCRIIDANFKSHYEDSKRTTHVKDWDRAIMISAYYRDKLGVPKTGEDLEFEIERIGTFGRIRALLQHPDTAIRIATTLAIISVIIGVMSILLSLGSVFLTVRR